MPNFKVTGSVTGLTTGSVVTEKQINDLPVGGVAKLLKNKAIEATDAKVSDTSEDRSAENVTGEPPPLRKDLTEEEQKDLRTPPHDAAARANPAKGGPGNVRRANKSDDN
jgi:hypothetical protein